MRAIRKYSGNVAAILGLALIAGLIGGYILKNQRLTLPSQVPFLGSDFVDYKATLPTAQSITPGQGQTVNVAGVQVGEISKVELVDGRAVVTMHLREKYTPIFKDATAVVRPKTGLNDMIIELSPGSKQSGVLPTGSPIPVEQSLANVNLDEILAGLDGDTRNYLQLLLGAGGQALDGNERALSNTFRRFEPTASALRRITGKLDERRGNIRRTITNFRKISETLAGKDKDLAALVDASESVFRSFANQDARLRETLRELPPTLQATNTGLAKVDDLAGQLGPGLERLRPAARALGPSLRQTRPFLRTTTPVIRDQLRPFSRDALPTIKLLRPAARDLAQITPDLTKTFGVVNYLLNELAYDKPGDGQDPYLFYFAWGGHLANALFGQADAHGPIRKGVVQVGCSSLQTLESIKKVNPQLGTLVSLLGAPQIADVCPQFAPKTGTSGASGASGSTGAPAAARSAARPKADTAAAGEQDGATGPSGSSGPTGIDGGEG
ncbi:MAG: MCE family protein [Solirubrobacterales bacterium]|nr:MCE family protein [Solirubrobacterales bacterium]